MAVGAAGLITGLTIGNAIVHSGVLPWDAFQPRPISSQGIPVTGQYSKTWDHGSIGFSNPRVVDYDDGAGPVGVVDVTASADATYMNTLDNRSKDAMGWGAVEYCDGPATGDLYSDSPCPWSTGYDSVTNVVMAGGRITSRAARSIAYKSSDVVIKFGRYDPSLDRSVITYADTYRFNQISGYKSFWVNTDFTCEGADGNRTNYIFRGGSWSTYSLHALSTPALQCPDGQKIIESSSIIHSSDGQSINLGGWQLSTTARTAGGPLHACFFNPDACALGWVDEDGHATSSPTPGDRCMWGGNEMPASDCSTPCPPDLVQRSDGQCVSGFQAVYESWGSMTRLATTSPTYYFKPATDFDYEKRRAVTQCIALAGVDRCRSGQPVFLPGSDVLEAAQHDFDAISGSGTQNGVSVAPAPTSLTYVDESLRPSSGWYENFTECIGSTQQSPCDEYPYRLSGEGGVSKASLKQIPRDANSREGSLLRTFLQQCGVTTTPDNNQFLVIPLEGRTGVTASGLDTQAWCKMAPS